VKKIGTKLSYRNRYDESGRMFPGVKERDRYKTFLVNCYDESGTLYSRVFDGVKKIGTKPLFSHHNLFS
jgi:hypothetical protein